MKKLSKLLSLVLVLCLVLSVAAVPGLALSQAAKPDDGTTTGQPFPAGTGGSQKFRIPALITLDDGTIVAAADARWSTSADYFGNDTIVSWSEDQGATWSYTFANYLGDGNNSKGGTTTIIDPALVYDSESGTIYMLVDLFPSGTNIWGCSAVDAFDDQHRLLLSNDDRSTYGYYLEDGKIYATDGTAVDGYSVDAYFNITGNGVDTNLFFSDSPYKVAPTAYLYLTTSTDGGKTWSEPALLDVKNNDERFYGVGPGRGLVTHTGRIIFPCYENHASAPEITSIIYSDDNGVTWHRGPDMTNSSSEATVVEVAYNGGYRLYMFTRHGGYYYSDDDGLTWSAQQPSPATYNSGCQISAISYSKTIEGKEAIFLSAPGNTSSRSAGKIFVLLVNDDGSLDHAYTYSVNGSNYYAYSCLTELADGSIGVLYESPDGALVYEALALDTLVRPENDPDVTVEYVQMEVGQSASLELSGNYQVSDLEDLDTAIATVTLNVTSSSAGTALAQLGNSADYTGDKISLEDCLYTFTESGGGYQISATADGTTVYLSPSVNGSGYPNSTTAKTVTITAGSAANSFYLNDGARYLHFWRDGKNVFDRVNTTNNFEAACSFLLYQAAGDGEASSTEIPGYVQVTSTADISAGEYLIVAQVDDAYYVLHPSTSTSSKYAHVAKVVGAQTLYTTTLEITGVAKGVTYARLGSNLVKITVTAPDEVDVELTVGQSKSFTIDGDATILIPGDSTIAGIDISPLESDRFQRVTAIESGKSYLIVSKGHGSMLTTASLSQDGYGGATSGLAMESVGSAQSLTVADPVLWTFTQSGSGYTISNGENYLNIKNLTDISGDDNWDAVLESTAQTLTVQNNGESFIIFADGNVALDAYNAGFAAAWQQTASFNENEQWYLYEMAARNEVTITGKAAGTTSIRVGNTIFNITVTEGHQHALTAVAAKDATCTEPGNIAYWYCADCGKYYSDEAASTEISQASTVISALDHNMGEWTITKDATCTEAGEKTRTCQREGCGHTETQAIDAKGHTEEVVTGKDATCTEPGLTDGKKCSTCGQVLEAQQEIPATGHNYENGVCTGCGEEDPDYVDPSQPSQPSTEPTEDDGPAETGDMSMPWTLLVMLTALIGTLVLLTRKRRI